MSEMDYNGPERRRGGPDRRANGERTRILLVDDHPFFRVGMRNILEKEPDFVIVGEADDSRSATDAAAELSPDIILMDLSLPPPGGIETTSRIKRELPSTGIIILAVEEDEEALFDAIRSGAAAFILKDVGPDDLVTIIRRVSAGEYLINDKVFRRPRSRPGCSRSSASSRSTARRRHRSSRRSRRARSRSSTTSPRA